uniref:Lysosomal amino acid transporter 1 n=1 Tax=Ditylenchus dipsaci TaxID=166011 RepID=A0A915D515_9BILA
MDYASVRRLCGHKLENCWLFRWHYISVSMAHPLFPQLYENYRTKRCEGLSIFFLMFWMIGDTCNMIGAVLTHQQPLQQIIGVYYILQDMVLLSQYVYYTKVYHANRQNMMVGSTIKCTFRLVVDCFLLSPVYKYHLSLRATLML